MLNLDYAYHFDDQGRTAGTSHEQHVRNMIEQVLFTAPGERVNRPTFGCGLRQLVFSPNSDQLTITTRALVEASLQEWLDDVILVEAVTVENDDALLQVSVQYILLRDQQRRTAEFSYEGLAK